MILHDITQRVSRWLHTDREIRRLQALDSRLLGDMGIEREHIADFVRGRCTK